MTNLPKLLVCVGVAGSALLVFVVAAKKVSRHEHPLTVTSAAVVQQKPVAAVVKLEAADSPVAADAIPPLPADATTIPDEYLLKLSGIVNLANARYGRPDKERWKQAIPIAEKLMAGPCDCEQRNWLKHFVEMGNFALSNADDDYYEDATLMATLGRNDKDAMARNHPAAQN